MRHPTEGVLRRLLDDPGGVADLDRDHVAGCAHCLDALTRARADAALVGAALAPPAGTEVDLAGAWQRLTAAASQPGPVHDVTPLRTRNRARLLRRPAAAAVAVAVVLTGASAAAANNWLQVFRTEKLAPVSVSTRDLIALPDLAAYGELDLTNPPNVRSVADADAAAAATGLDVPQAATLPRGIGGAPTYQVADKVTATFTFSAERAARAAADAGEPLPPVPAGLDGSRLRLMAGPGVAAVWSSGTGAPGLIVGRAVAPTAFSSGVPFATARDYLLSLPGLPDKVAAQLRAFSADGATLPLPVPSDDVRTSSAQIQGVPATVLSARDRSMAAVVWVRAGVLTAVAGSLDVDEVLSVARDLR